MTIIARSASVLLHKLAPARCLSRSLAPVSDQLEHCRARICRQASLAASQNAQHASENAFSDLSIHASNAFLGQFSAPFFFEVCFRRRIQGRKRCAWARARAHTHTPHTRHTHTRAGAEEDVSAAGAEAVQVGWRGGRLTSGGSSPALLCAGGRGEVGGQEGEGCAEGDEKNRGVGEERNPSVGEARADGGAAAVGHLSPSCSCSCSCASLHAGPVDFGALPQQVHVAVLAQGRGGGRGLYDGGGGQVWADAALHRDAGGAERNVSAVTQRKPRWTMWMVLICFHE